MLVNQQMLGGTLNREHVSEPDHVRNGVLINHHSYGHSQTALWGGVTIAATASSTTALTMVLRYPPTKKVFDDLPTLPHIT